MISKSRLNATLRDARTFVFLTECAGCGQPDVRVCPSCVELLQAQPRVVPLAHVMERVSLPVLSCGVYDETFARVLHALKDAGRTGLARDLAPRLRAGIAGIEALTAAPEAAAAAGLSARSRVRDRFVWPTRFVAPPSTLANRRVRGFEPLELIARHARITLWQPLDSARRREDQARLGVSARAHNMRHSLRARGSLAGASVIVIDDVMTTGSTLVEMTRVLVDAGADVRGAVVLAHTERQWPQTRHAHL